MSIAQQGDNVHFRFRDTFYGVCPVSVSLDCHDDRFRATRGHGTGTVWVVVHPEAHGDDFSFHLADGRKNIWVNGVGDAIPLVRRYDDLLEVLAAVYETDL
jgi:hypothetical protein